jgi:hypothetical protein
MWLEVVQDSRHVGVLVSRAEITSRDDLDAVLETLPRWPAEYAEEIQARMPASIVYGVMWQDWQGAAELRGELAYHLDAEGYYQRSAFWPFVEPGYEDQETDDVPWRQIMVTLYTGTVTTLHAFARMNCHNVTLVPMAAGAPRLKKGKRHPPFSVWHEIAVTGLPQLRREQGGGLPDGEKRELRFHKVRGHYADYTKGKGLFGRLKVRIWIEEHAAGRSELGTVAGSYRIE